MLGIRRLGTVSIDLYQGDPAGFVADVQASSAQGIAGLGPSVRHVAVVAAKDVEELAKLKAVLISKEAPQGLRRVTFVLGSLDLYYAFQDELFRLFPEAEGV